MAKLASFKDYINDHFYDSIFQVVSAYVEENPQNLDCSTHKVRDPDAARLDDMTLRMLDITGTICNELKLDVIVIAEIEISETNPRHELESDLGNQWFRVSCSCDVSDGIKNFRVGDVRIYWPDHRKKPGQLSDYLVPIIHKEDLDATAEDFLHQYYPEALEKPTRISVQELTKRMGLTIRQEHLTKNCSVFGQVFFDDCIVPCYDQERGVYKDVAVEEGTVLVDPDVFFMYTLGSYNNTIVHECVHWGLHRRFFELEKLYNPEAKSIICQVREGEANEKKRSPLEWMEWQANQLAPRIMMPATQARAKIEELFENKRMEFPHAPDSDILERVIIDLAEFFGASKQAAKIRMIDLGYNEAIGVFNYTDRHYVQGHSFQSKALAKNQTFNISQSDLAFLFATDNVFRPKIESGSYVYVDSHLCINNSKYIGRTAAGTACLTDYALQHMDECCLAFDVTTKKVRDYGVAYYTECALFKSALSDSKEEVSFPDNAFNKAIDAAALDNAEFRESVLAQRRAIKLLAPMEFPEALDKLMQDMHVTNDALANDCLLSPDTIRRFRTGGKHPKLPTVIALCVGLKLPSLISGELVKKAGYSFNYSERDIAYQVILSSMTQNSIYECNEMLASLNLGTLTRDE